MFLILRSGLECDVSWHRSLKDQVDSNTRARWLTDPGMLVVSAHDRHAGLHGYFSMRTGFLWCTEQ